MRKLRLVVPLALAMSLSVVPPTAAQPAPEAEVVEIAAELGPGFATAVSRQGVIVGATPFPFTPWIWRNGTRTDLPTLGGAAVPQAINTRGDVVGWAEDGADGPWVGVRWSRANIEVIEGFTVARDINDRGEIVGNGPEGALHHWRGTTTVLPDGQSATANAINQRGLIVGALDSQAVAWRDGVLEYLPVADPFPTERDNVAFDVSDRGHIVGNRWDMVDRDGFRLSPDGTYEELATWLGGFVVTVTGVDRFGRAIGTEGEETTSFAVAWLPGADRPVQLASYWDEDVWLEWWPSGANDINDRGTVVGWVADPETGRTTAVMWQLPR